ncbi:hypothetical protein [Paenibacillus sp. V4I5]|nr:hypothetical protein [Paenibacillus sp. V4I5]MDQ0916114.1 hypothetical protein [Paenibacillus sp. V4I5]
MMKPFMEIEDWDRIGLSVAESAKRLQRIAYIDRQLMRIQAGHMIARPEYEIKGALGRMVWEDASHYDQFRNRCKQMRMSTVAFDKCPDPFLERTMIKLLDSGNTLTLLTAMFEVIKPAQIEAIQDYLSLAQPIADYPTIHMLRHQLMDRENQVQWGLEAIRAISEQTNEEERTQAENWKACMKDYLLAAGGVNGLGERKELDPTLEVASTSFELPESSTRDSRFKKTVAKFTDVTFEDSDAGRFKRMMFTRFNEMTPAEAVACVHFASEGKPWLFYYDTARHLWDEIRHSWFGEAALRIHGFNIYESANWTGWYDMTQNLFSIEEAYTHLTIAIEKSAMKYPPGKREEWEFCRDVVKDSLMTTFQDFDWADEVVHAGFGQKWVIDHQYNGDSTQAQQAADLT